MKFYVFDLTHHNHRFLWIDHPRHIHTLHSQVYHAKSTFYHRRCTFCPMCPANISALKSFMDMWIFSPLKVPDFYSLLFTGARDTFTGPDKEPPFVIIHILVKLRHMKSHAALVYSTILYLIQYYFFLSFPKT